jgi:hypothetical protein
MERNQETLSTRDLATGSDPVADVAEHERASGRREDTDSPARDMRSQPENGLHEGEDGNAPAQPVADTNASPSPSTATRAGSTSARGADVTTSQAQNVAAAASPGGSSEPASTNGAPLLSEELSATFQRRWEEVQTRFVDEPRGAVEDADGLVANLMQQLAEGFAQERERLEAQWGRGEDISTEDLRVALQRYRSFFQRLLTT